MYCSEEDMASENDLSRAQRLYDFVRFTFTDLHGIGRSRTVPKYSLEGAFSDGISAFNASLGFGIKGEFEPYFKAYKTRPQELVDKIGGNLYAVPVPGTLRPLPTSGAGEYTVGQVLCETRFAFSGEVQEECPRFLARRELERLESMGFFLYGSVEVEFLLVKEGTQEPVFGVGEMFANRTFSKFEPLLLEIAATLKKMGIEVESIQTEIDGGQFEFALKPQIGIMIADNAFLAKECIKEVSRKHGYTAIFMAYYTSNDVGGNAAHFNHSLKEISKGKNAFSDVTRQDRLSDTFRNWMGGLTKHFTSQVALSNPTTNCYRRLGREWCPSAPDWGIEDRKASYRVKVESPKITYIESRHPSGACNIYLVLAATVCSGIDGLKNRIPCPFPRIDVIRSEEDREDYVKFEPESFKPCQRFTLDILNSNVVFKESLGEYIIQWFTAIKDDELEKYDEAKLDEKGKIAWERERYAYLL